MPPSRSITEIAAIIAENTAVVDEYFSSNGIPTPSFSVDGPARVRIPPTETKVAEAHATVLGATMELHNLMLGPEAMLMNINSNDVVSLHAVYHYEIAGTFPVNEEASFESISSKCGLNEVDLKRLLRHAMTNHIFEEPRKGIVAHTAASRLLAEDQLMRDFVGIACEEHFPGAPRVIDALVKYGKAQDPSQSGFSLGHNTNKGLYDELRANPERGQRFAGAMSAFASRLSLDPIINSFDWASLGKGATIVDVAGGWGPVSIGLARRFPDLKFIVQDLPDVVAEGLARLPPDLAQDRDRFQFMPYSVFTEQQVKGADVYFSRALYHNWPDASCIEILRNQIPALKPGAHLIIAEPFLPEPGTLSPYMEKRLRAMDLNMLNYFGSRERTVEDWEDTLHEADPRFELKKPPTDIFHILDVCWKG